MKAQIVIVFLVLLLAACTPSQPIPVDAQNTALAIVQTGIALTQTAQPTVTPPLPTFMPTATPTAMPTFSPVPTLVRPILTPDAIQLKRWQEYQTELADALELSSDSICEWDILGRFDQEVYVWAYCANEYGGSEGVAAAIYLYADGSIQKIKTASYWMVDGNVMSNEDELFPADVIEKLDLYKVVYPYTGRPEEIRLYLHYRLANPGVLPWVVLLATPTTPTP